MIWDQETVTAIMRLRSFVQVTMFDVFTVYREAEARQALRNQAGENLIEAARSYGVEIHESDIRYWEVPVRAEEPVTGEPISAVRINARWFPSTGLVEFRGGHQDGDRITLTQGAIGREVITAAPAPRDPVWTNEDLGPESYAPYDKVTYYPAGWHEENRYWIYSPSP